MYLPSMVTGNELIHVYNMRPFKRIAIIRKPVNGRWKNDLPVGSKISTCALYPETIYTISSGTRLYSIWYLVQTRVSIEFDSRS